MSLNITFCFRDIRVYKYCSEFFLSRSLPCLFLFYLISVYSALLYVLLAHNKILRIRIKLC